MHRERFTYPEWVLLLHFCYGAPKGVGYLLVQHPVTIRVLELGETSRMFERV